MTADKILTIEEGGANESEIRRALEKLKETSVSHTNFREALSRVSSSAQIISSQIENHRIQFKRAHQKHEEVKERVGERLEDMRKNSIVPLDLYTAASEARYHLTQMYAWQNILSEFEHILAKKLASALNSVSDYQVESKALEGAKELIKMLISSHKEEILMRLEAMNKKIGIVEDTNQRRMSLLVQNVMMQMQEVQRLQQEKNQDTLEMILGLVRKASSEDYSDDELRSEIKELVISVRQGNQDLAREFKELQKNKEVPVSREDIKEFEKKLLAEQRALRDQLEDLQLAPSESQSVAGEVEEEYDAITEEVDDEVGLDDDLDLDSFPDAKKKTASQSMSGSEDKSDFVCEYCGDDFVDEIALETHIDVKHADEED